MTKLNLKLLLITIIVACPALLISQDSSESGSNKFSDATGRFKIWFPSIPTPSSQETATDLGTVTLYQFTYESAVEAYMVSYVDYPMESIVDMDKSQMINNAKTGFCNALSLTVDGEGAIYAGSYEGIWFDATNYTDTYCVMRDFLVGNRLYQVCLLSSAEITDELKFKFLNSFEITE